MGEQDNIKIIERLDMVFDKSDPPACYDDFFRIYSDIDEEELAGAVRELYNAKLKDWLVDNGYIVKVGIGKLLEKRCEELRKRYPDEYTFPCYTVLKRDNGDIINSSLKTLLYLNGYSDIKEWLKEKGLTPKKPPKISEPKKKRIKKKKKEKEKEKEKTNSKTVTRKRTVVKHRKAEEPYDLAPDDYQGIIDRLENVFDKNDPPNSYYELFLMYPTVRMTYLEKAVKELYNKEAYEWLLENGYIVKADCKTVLDKTVSRLENRYAGLPKPQSYDELQIMNDDLITPIFEVFVELNKNMTAEELMIEKGLIVQNTDISIDQ